MKICLAAGIRLSATLRQQKIFFETQLEQMRNAHHQELSAAKGNLEQDGQQLRELNSTLEKQKCVSCKTRIGNRVDESRGQPQASVRRRKVATRAGYLQTQVSIHKHHR